MVNHSTSDVNDQNNARNHRPNIDDFWTFYNSHLKDWLDKQADKQKRALAQFILFALLGTAILVIVYMRTDLFTQISQIWDYLPYLIVIVYLFVVFYFSWSPLHQVSSEADQKIIAEIGRPYDIYHNQSTYNFPIDPFKTIHILPYFEEAKSYMTDYLAGEYKDIIYSVVEAKLNETRGSDMNNRSTAKVFSGLLISLSTPIDRKSRCVISEKSGFQLPWTRRIKDMEPTQSQNEALNRDYDIYASDPETTVQWLDDMLANKLIILTNKLHENSNIRSGIRYGFIKNNFLIVIPTAKKFFEPGSFRKINDPARAHQTYEGICVIYDIIDLIAK